MHTEYPDDKHHHTEYSSMNANKYWYGCAVSHVIGLH
jgi:hypothetical protein